MANDRARVFLVQLDEGGSYYLRTEKRDGDGNPVVWWLRVSPDRPSGFRDDARAVHREHRQEVEERLLRIAAHDVAVWYPAPNERWGLLQGTDIPAVPGSVVDYIGPSTL
jgi:hypothetical protein